jgi:uncharacterized membrane protein YhfC
MLEIFFLIQIFVAFGLPIFLMLFFVTHASNRRSAISMIAVGISFFLLTQVLRIPILAVTALENLLTLSVVLESIWFIFFSGVTEECLRYCAMRFIPVVRRNLQISVIGYVIGYTGIESILVVGMSISGVFVAYFLYTNHLVDIPVTSEVRQQIGEISSLPVYMPLVGVVSNVSTIIVKLGVSLVVAASVYFHKPLYLILAIILNILFGILIFMFSHIWGDLMVSLIATGFSVIILYIGYRFFQPKLHRLRDID